MNARPAILVVPASSERMLGKADQLPADELVLDLEDAVLPARKEAARAAALAALAGALQGHGASVRVNGPGTPWAHLDLIALGSAQHRPRSVVIPKVQGPGDLAFVDRLLDGVERAAGHTEPMRVQAVIETAAGLRRLDEIAAASPRLESAILGYADLGASLGRSAAGAADLDRWLAIQDQLLAAARAAGLQAIDGPSFAIGDQEIVNASCERAALLGFDAKWAIHPSQLQPIRDAFSPTPAEVEHAQRVLEALAGAAQDAAGAAMANGQMVDEALLRSAERTLARAGLRPGPAR
jgi:citrate lyase subunit beta / citryl-CoA lyase